MLVVVCCLHLRESSVATSGNPAPDQIWSLGSSFQFCKQILSAELLFTSRAPRLAGGTGSMGSCILKAAKPFLSNTSGKITWDHQTESLTERSQLGCEPWRIGQKGIQPQISISQPPAVIGQCFIKWHGAENKNTQLRSRLTRVSCEWG